MRAKDREIISLHKKITEQKELNDKEINMAKEECYQDRMKNSKKRQNQVGTKNQEKKKIRGEKNRKEQNNEEHIGKSEYELLREKRIERNLAKMKEIDIKYNKLGNGKKTKYLSHKWVR